MTGVQRSLDHPAVGESGDSPSSADCLSCKKTSFLKLNGSSDWLNSSRKKGRQRKLMVRPRQTARTMLYHHP